jgi:hypothetical protein
MPTIETFDECLLPRIADYLPRRIIRSGTEIMAKTTAWKTPDPAHSPREAATMTPTILAHLLEYRNDGEYCADPVTIEAQMVEDERHGVVLEIPLPSLEHQGRERVVQIPLQQLRRSIQCFT